MLLRIQFFRLIKDWIWFLIHLEISETRRHF